MGTKIVREEFFELLVQKIRVRVSLSEETIRKIMVKKLGEYGFTLRKTPADEKATPEQLAEKGKIIEIELTKAGI